MISTTADQELLEEFATYVSPQKVGTYRLAGWERADHQVAHSHGRREKHAQRLRDDRLPGRPVKDHIVDSRQAGQDTALDIGRDRDANRSGLIRSGDAMSHYRGPRVSGVRTAEERKRPHR